MVDGLLSSLNLLEFRRYNHKEILKRKQCGGPSSNRRVKARPKGPSSQPALPLLLGAGHQAQATRQPLSLSHFQPATLGTTSDYFLSRQWEPMELLINMTRGRESKSHHVCARLCQEFAENMFVNV